jgi:hypothetical protein
VWKLDYICDRRDPFERGLHLERGDDRVRVVFVVAGVKRHVKTVAATRRDVPRAARRDTSVGASTLWTTTRGPRRSASQGVRTTNPLARAAAWYRATSRSICCPTTLYPINGAESNVESQCRSLVDIECCDAGLHISLEGNSHERAACSGEGRDVGALAAIPGSCTTRGNEEFGFLEEPLALLIRRESRGGRSARRPRTAHGDVTRGDSRRSRRGTASRRSKRPKD